MSHTNYLIMLQGPINEKGRLLLHPFGDGMSHCVVGLGASGTVLHAVFIIHILLSCPETEKVENHTQTFWCVCYFNSLKKKKKKNGKPEIASMCMVSYHLLFNCLAIKIHYL